MREFSQTLNHSLVCVYFRACESYALFVKSRFSLFVNTYLFKHR